HRAMTDIASNPDLDSLLSQLGTMLSGSDREDVALLMVKVLAADGKADADEMERMRDAGLLVGISAAAMHRAYNRYFAETQTGF
ncbi:MAG: TerB family tellurite resistance protein, partial [Pseudomonadota bacterium]